MKKQQAYNPLLSKLISITDLISRSTNLSSTKISSGAFKKLRRGLGDLNVSNGGGNTSGLNPGVGPGLAYFIPQILV